MKGTITQRGKKFRAFYYFEGKNLTKTHDTPEAAERWLAGLWLKEKEGGLDSRLLKGKPTWI